MYGYIDGVNFHELEAEKYWSFPKTYKGNRKEETKYMITSGDYYGSLKRDGHYARFIKDEDGNMMLQGRTKSVSGDFLNKIDWVPQCKSFFDSLPNGTCLLGELYFPNQKGSRKVTTILGCLLDKALQRQEAGEKLCYYVFDVWAYDRKSLLNKTMKERVESFINEILTKYFDNQKYVTKAVYYDGNELWSKLGEYLNNGEEGIVITQKSSVPAPGKRTARKTLKIKQEINDTIDVFLDGDYKKPTRLYTGKEISNWQFWENIKTGELINSNMYDEYISGRAWEPVTKNYFYNRAGAVSISVMKDGKPFHIGYISGITDEMRQGIVDDPEKYIGKVFEVSAMEIECIFGEYSLRHGKFIQERTDKKPEDCDFSQIVQ